MYKKSFFYRFKTLADFRFRIFLHPSWIAEPYWLGKMSGDYRFSVWTNHYWPSQGVRSSKLFILHRHVSQIKHNHLFGLTIINNDHFVNNVQTILRSQTLNQKAVCIVNSVEMETLLDNETIENIAITFVDLT